MAYIQSNKLIKELAKQECLRQNLYETALTDSHRATTGSKELIKPEAIKKSVYESALTVHCQKLGLKSYLEQLTQVKLTVIYDSIREIVEGEVTKKNNKIFLVKTITRAVIVDLKQFFEDLEGEEAKIFQELTETKNPVDMIEEITLVGLEIFLFTVQAVILAQLCTNLVVKYEAHSNNPTVMVTSILTGKAPVKKEAPAKKKITFSKKKLALKKGLTYHDIFQHYYNEELVEFCRKHGMKLSGTKKQLVERILRFLNEGFKEIPNAKRIAKQADKAAAEAQETVTDEEEEEEEVAEEEEEEVVEEAAAEEEDEDNVELEAEEVERPEEAPVVETKPSKLKKSRSDQSKIVNSPNKAAKSGKKN